MDKVILLVTIGLLVLAIKYHVLTQTLVKKKIDKTWYDRLWTGSRPSKDNLTDEGLKYRKQSNICAIAGFCMLGIFVMLKMSST